MSNGLPAPFLCMYPGCECQRRRKAFFCFSHWLLLPWVLQRKLVHISRVSGRDAAISLIPGAVEAITKAQQDGGRNWRRTE